MDSTFPIILVVSTLGFIVFTFVLGRWLSKRLLGGSPAKQAEAQRLMETGSRARATILSIDPTGTILNEINIQCLVQFRLDPLDGAGSFQGEKTFFINQTRMPRVGDVWPCWYDPTDQTKFGVGQPDLADPEAQRTLAEFGIANPITGAAGATPEPSADPGDGDDRLDDLERLADLRSRGLLTDVEFEAEKRRVLGT